MPGICFKIIQGMNNDGNTCESRLATSRSLLKLDGRYMRFMILLSLLLYMLEILCNEGGDIAGEAKLTIISVPWFQDMESPPFSVIVASLSSLDVSRYEDSLSELK